MKIECQHRRTSTGKVSSPSCRIIIIMLSKIQNKVTRCSDSKSKEIVLRVLSRWRFVTKKESIDVCGTVVALNFPSIPLSSTLFHIIAIYFAARFSIPSAGVSVPSLLLFTEPTGGVTLFQAAPAGHLSTRTLMHLPFLAGFQCSSATIHAAFCY